MKEKKVCGVDVHVWMCVCVYVRARARACIAIENNLHFLNILNFQKQNLLYYSLYSYKFFKISEIHTDRKRMSFIQHTAPNPGIANA